MTNTMQNGRQTWPNVANTCKYHAKCKVTMPKCCKYHAKWQVLVPNCCKYKANGTGKESQKKIQNLRQKPRWKPRTRMYSRAWTTSENLCNRKTNLFFPCIVRAYRLSEGTWSTVRKKTTNAQRHAWKTSLEDSTYFPCYQSAVWSGKCRVWSVKCGVGSVECLKCRVWSVECKV